MLLVINYKNVLTEPLSAKRYTDEYWWNREVVDYRIDFQPEEEFVVSR